MISFRHHLVSLVSFLAVFHIYQSIADLVLPASEKSPLPSIIVTPSSPGLPLSGSSSPFYIAFLAPPPKPSLCERIAALATPTQFNARITLILFILLIIMFCHVLTHRLAMLPHRVDFGVLSPGAKLGNDDSPFLQWFSPRSLWGTSATAAPMG
jgi:COMPASS component SWD1